MKNYPIFLLVFAISLGAQSAALKEPFTCEKIKDRPTRAACIDARESKTKADAGKAVMQAQEEERIAAEKELIAEKRKATDELVSKAKGLLVQNLKDPESAKFSNLVIAHGPNRKLVCGSINAKNSYGGYVGAKKFFVLWNDSSETSPEVYTDGDEISRATTRMNELSRVSQSAGLSEQIEAAQEGDRLMAKVKLEVARNAKILNEQCTASNETAITAVEN